MKLWSKEDDKKLKELVSLDKYRYVKIAEIMKKNAGTVRYQAKRLGLKNKASFNINIKHKHLREPVLKYYLTHSAEDTARKFNLSKSEFKSCLTQAYGDPFLKYLRKETRRHDPWTTKEYLFLLRHSGLRERKWISSKLKRGGLHAIKDRIALIHASTKIINGLSQKTARFLLREEIDGIKTKAGPISKTTNFRFIIVPWVLLYKRAKLKKHIPEHIKLCLKALSKFQKKIHGTRGIEDTLKSIKGAINGSD